MLLLAELAVWRSASRVVTMMPGVVGLGYRAGRIVSEYGPGRYRLFDPFDRVLVFPVITAPQAPDQQRIDEISQNRFAFRLDIAPLVKVLDLRLFLKSTALLGSTTSGRQADWALLAGMAGHNGPFARLTPLLLAAVVEAVAGHKLEAFLDDPQAALAPLEPSLAASLPGVRLDGLKLVAIILPPEI